MKKVLFVHHGGVAGGAPLSMLYTMNGMRDRGFEPIAGLMKPSEDLHKLYNSNGYATNELPYIPRFITSSGSEGKRVNPIMWKGVYDAFKAWKNSKERLKAFILEHDIQLVHLNSVSLSNVADLCFEEDIPYVWHVREYAPKHRGMRYRFIQRRLLRSPSVIFLSKAEEQSWLEGKGAGNIIHNFIDFEMFKHGSGYMLNENKNYKTLLYVGGIKSYKGIITLLEALIHVKAQYKKPFKCLMPDTYLKEKSKLNRLERRVGELINAELKEICVQMPFNPNIVDLYRQCDVLVFPATQPHFARPVIEAAAMKKPVIASALQPIDELVVHGETGYLTTAGDAKSLANRIIELLSDPEKCRIMGRKAYDFALHNFEFNRQADKIEEVYLKTLSGN